MRTAERDKRWADAMSDRSTPSHAPDRRSGRADLSPWGLVLLLATVALAATGHWTLVVAVLGLALLIFVHELGHFLAAKACGMRVERFYIGFPPAILKHTRGETEYGVGLIPLGGFCTIAGMTSGEQLPADVAPRAYSSKPVWQRNLTLAAGPGMNFLAAFLIMFVFIQAGGLQQPSLTVDSVVKGTPAAAAGLRAGDQLVAGDGVRFTSWDQASRFFASRPHRTVRLLYRTPSGLSRTTSVTLASRPGQPDQGYLGVSPRLQRVQPTPWRAAGLAVADTARLVTATFKGLWLIVSGRVDPVGPQGASGPLGIISVSQTAERQSWYPILLALVSVNLGIINLLPFLPFDGGQIFFNCVEAVRRRPVDQGVMQRASAVGMLVLVILFLLATYNDLQRIFHFG